MGKKSAASKAKDNRLLASLGGVVTTSGGSKMVNEVVNTGKYKGKPMGSLLSHEQKAVVAKVILMRGVILMKLIDLIITNPR